MPPISPSSSDEQQQEVEVLRAIYGLDFLDEPQPNQPKAWGAKAHAEFGLRLRGSYASIEEGSDREVAATLVVRYSKTYPASSPTLSFIAARNVSSAQLSDLTRLVQQEARANIGEVVVFNLAVFVQDWLSDHVAPPPLPLSKELDATAESLLVVKAKREEEARAAKRESTQVAISQQAQEEEDRARIISQKISEHKARQVAFAATTLAPPSISSSDELSEITFDSSNGGVEGTYRIFGGVRDALWTTHLAIPSAITNVSSSSSSATGHTDDYEPSPPTFTTYPTQSLSMIVVDLCTPYYSSSQGSQKLQAMIDTLKNKVIVLRNEQVVPVLAVKLVEGRRKRGRRLFVLQGRVGRGERLRGVLRVCGRMDLSVARDHLIQVLAGLEAMREQGVTHDDVSLDTIILSPSSGGARLSEPCFRRRIIDMDRSNPFVQESLKDVDLDDGEVEMGDESEGEALPFNWLSPDELEASHSFTHKRDVFHAAVCFLRMILGSDVVYRYPDLATLLDSDEIYLPDALASVIRSMLNPSSKDRFTAKQAILGLSVVDLTRISGASLKDTSARTVGHGKPARSPGVGHGPIAFFDRQTSNGAIQHQHPAMTSRYRADFEEVEFLGEGGFGKVVKARNRLDGRFYAIKKIKLRPEDNEQKVFREVNALSRLNHQFIVRYFTCWLEYTASPLPVSNVSSAPESGASTHMSSSISSLQTSSSFNSPRPQPFDDDMFRPTDADFLSVRGHQSRSRSFPSIHFSDGNADDEDDDEEDTEDLASSSEEEDSTEEEESRSARKHEPRGREEIRALRMNRIEPSTAGSVALQGSRTLYIQMEYVENQTLKEAIARGLSEEEAWRLFRQILEALTHMASLGIVHRDLKPSNLLIDHENCIKIGDFGLAATDFAPNETFLDASPMLRMASDAADLTSGIGTSLYIAPEVESGSGKSGSYNDLADMFSLGIIFFEMNLPLTTGMERAFVIRDLRSPAITFPANWNKTQKAQQSRIIELLLQHDPARRPRAITLLTNGMLPSVKEDEYFVQALRTFANPSSTRYPVLFNHIFAQVPEAVSDFTFDDPDINPKEHRVYEALIKDRLVDLFVRHGAIDWEPPPLLPVSELLAFRKEPGARFLNRQGQLVELPYDGLVSFARHVARTKHERLKRYHIGSSYRENLSGGQPLSSGEINYDILSPVRSMASEAELISVLDRILDSFPGLSLHTEWEFTITHSRVLDLVLEKVPVKKRGEVCDVLRELGGRVGFNQVRSRLAVSRAVVDTLDKWAVCDPVDAAVEKLSLRFPHLATQIEQAVKEIQEVVVLAEKLGVRRKIVLRPTMSHRFMRSGILFECVRKKAAKREPLGVGGRYDNLVEHFRLTSSSIQPAINLVGMQVSLERIALIVGKHESTEGKRLISLDAESQRSFGWTPRRCDVYVGSFGAGLMEDRVEIVGELWGMGLSADLMYEDGVGMSVENVMAECLAQGILFLVITKGRLLLKVRSILRRTEEDVYRADLTSYLRTALADQRRVDVQSAPALPSTSAAFFPSHHHSSTGIQDGANGGGGGRDEQIKLVLPSDKVAGNMKPPKKSHRHGTKALFYEKARTFISLVRSPLPVYALDLPASLLSTLALDSSWLLPPSSDHPSADDVWRNARDRIPQPGYAALVREELREAWEDEGSEGAAACWLFSVREERGFLLVWPQGGGKGK